MSEAFELYLEFLQQNIFLSGFFVQLISDSMELSTGFFQKKKENYQIKNNQKDTMDPENTDFSYLLRNLAKQQFSVTHLVVGFL